MTDTINQLARACAIKGLRLKEANALFESLYTADALVRNGGNQSKAAASIGMERGHYRRLLLNGRRERE